MLKREVSFHVELFKAYKFAKGLLTKTVPPCTGSNPGVCTKQAINQFIDSFTQLLLISLS